MDLLLTSAITRDLTNVFKDFAEGNNSFQSLLTSWDAKKMPLMLHKRPRQLGHDAYISIIYNALLALPHVKSSPFVLFCLYIIYSTSSPSVPIRISPQSLIDLKAATAINLEASRLFSLMVKKHMFQISYCNGPISETSRVYSDYQRTASVISERIPACSINMVYIILLLLL